jgi:peptide subunit release factor RF-3
VLLIVVDIANGVEIQTSRLIEVCRIREVRVCYDLLSIKWIEIGRTPLIC